MTRWLSQAKEVTPPGLKKPVWRWNRSPDVAAAATSAAAGAVPNDATPVEGPAIRVSGDNEADPDLGSSSRVRSACVSHLDAHRLLSCCALNEDYYDLVDVDSFGSDTSFLGAAIESVK